MKHKKKRLIDYIVKKKHVEVKYLCNYCGEDMISKDGIDNVLGLVDIKAQGCYSSVVLQDLTTYQFSLCEICLDNLFSKFKITPVIKHLLNKCQS